MRSDRQRGMTLIELLVSMAVTSILLVGLTSVFFNVSSRYQSMADRLHNASAGTGLAASLQADSHRYVVCALTPLDLDTPDLYLCPADDPSLNHPVVEYHVSGPAPYVITRQQLTTQQTPTFMARKATDPAPAFWVDCIATGNVSSGHVHVRNLRLDDGLGSTSSSQPPGPSPENFSVYYAAPWRAGCS